MTNPIIDGLTIKPTYTILLTCMRKEFLWAGIVGITFGLVLAFGAWRVKSTVTTKNISAPSPTPQAEIGKNRITLNKPRNLDVITASPYTVSGITKSSSWVVISMGGSDYLSKSETDGSFSVEIKPEAGINQIKATSLNDQGGASTQEVLVVYSPSFQPESQTDKTSDQESEIDSDVSLKLAEAENPPKAYIGTVTDIADSTIQIKSTDSQIQQIATNKYDIDAVDTKGSANKSIKLTDIGIGDYIIAMGYVNGNDVLNAKRILVANTLTDTQITVSMQKVESVNKKSLTLSSPSGGEVTTLTPDKNTKIKSFSDDGLKSIKISDIEASDTVITVLDTTGSPSLSRAVFNIEHKSKED